MSDDLTLATSLAHSAQLADPAEYKAEAARAPGGEYVVAHIDDGPYELLLLAGDLDAADFKAKAVLEAFPPIKLKLNIGWGSQDMYLVAVPKYGAEVLNWYTDDVSYSVESDGLAMFNQAPTDRDLAAALPDILDIDEEKIFALREAFVAAYDAVGIEPVLRLVQELDDDIVEDADQLIAVVSGVLTEPQKRAAK